MAHFFLFHGYNDWSSGERNLDQVADPLIRRGNTVDKDSADYGWFGLLWVRMRKHGVVLRMVNAVRAAILRGDNVVIVAYSNGCNYAIKALALIFVGQVKLVLLHPALKSNTEIPGSVSRFWVYTTRSDWAVRMAMLVRWLIPGWGNMGVKGYTGTDARGENRDRTDIAKGHGGLFKTPEILEFLADELHAIGESS